MEIKIGYTVKINKAEFEKLKSRAVLSIPGTKDYLDIIEKGIEQKGVVTEISDDLIMVKFSDNWILPAHDSILTVVETATNYGEAYDKYIRNKEARGPITVNYKSGQPYGFGIYFASDAHILYYGGGASGEDYNVSFIVTPDGVSFKQESDGLI